MSKIIKTLLPDGRTQFDIASEYIAPIDEIAQSCIRKDIADSLMQLIEIQKTELRNAEGLATYTTKFTILIGTLCPQKNDLPYPMGRK